MVYPILDDLDAGAPSKDAASTDAALIDAAPSTDAASFDARPPDGGASQDAGDAAVSDPCSSFDSECER
jgi:hypothetical protein